MKMTDDCDESEDDDPMGKEPAECDGDTPLDEVLAKIQWTDAGVVSSDPRLKDHDPASFEPDLRMAKKEENNLLDWWLHWYPKSLIIKIVAAINNNAAKIKFPANGRWKLLVGSCSRRENFCVGWGCGC
jgi:hypothetical protein